MSHRKQHIAEYMDEMNYREFCDLVEDLKAYVDGNTSKDPVEKWRSAISAWAENNKDQSL